MPLTRVIIAQDKMVERGGESVTEMLFTACCEIIPAGISSAEAPLTPGSIVYLPGQGLRRHLTVDVFVEIEAYYTVDRFANLDERSATIGRALTDLFQPEGLSFAVWPKLVIAGWWREQPDPAFQGDMSMPAAIERAREDLEALFPHRGLHL